MSLWLLLGVVCIAGGVGGLINSLLTDRGFVMPRFVQTVDQNRVWYPGFLGNLLTGAIAGGLSWLLYGPLSQVMIGTVGPSIALATLGGAVLVGMAGSGWLANAAGKSLFRAAASHAALASPSPNLAQQIMAASPVDALAMAKEAGSGRLPSTTGEPSPGA